MATHASDGNATLTTVPPSPGLTEEQDSKYEELLSHVSKWQNSFHGKPLGEHERRFLTQECLLRYLRAAKWIVGDSLTRLDATILWRREHHIDELVAEGSLDKLIRNGMLLPLGYDKTGRPCLYYSLRQDTPDLSEVQLQYLCFMAERTIDMMHPGVESITVIIDLEGISRSTIPSIAKIRAYISAFQEHNPERLGLVVVPSVLPWWFHGLWRMIRYFLDPVVRDKIKLDGDVSLYVPKDHLWAKYGGGLPFETFEKAQDTYWTEFLREAGKIREEYVKRWESAGKRIGESEWHLKGGSSNGDSTGKEWILQKPDYAK